MSIVFMSLFLNASRMVNMRIQYLTFNFICLIPVPFAWQNYNNIGAVFHLAFPSTNPKHFRELRRQMNRNTRMLIFLFVPGALNDANKLATGWNKLATGWFEFFSLFFFDFVRLCCRLGYICRSNSYFPPLG